MKRWKAALLVLAGAVPGLAGAHGGEDHGGARPAPAAMVQGLSAGAMGETFEVLVKAPESEPREATALRVFVSDARTNAPLQGAEVELSFLSASEVKLAATPSDSAGIYTASATFPSEGDWEAMATVRRGSETEVLSLGAWKVAPHVHADEPASGLRTKAPLLAVLGAGAVGAGLWTVMRTQRSRRRAQEVSNAR